MVIKSCENYLPKIDKPNMRYCQVSILNQMAIEHLAYTVKARLA
jgi:hypothetical protein